MKSRNAKGQFVRTTPDYKALYKEQKQRADNLENEMNHWRNAYQGAYKEFFAMRERFEYLFTCSTFITRRRYFRKYGEEDI